MRVIAGVCKGRPLKAVGGNNTRPTTDKVKETIFNMIGPFFSGGQALDLYSGSGGLGIEALSRGIDQAVFIDKFGPAIAAIKENVSRCHFKEKADIYRNTVNRALAILTKREAQFDLVFMDPPYAKQQISKEINLLLKGNLLKEEAIVVVEHDDAICLPEYFSTSLKQWKHQTYHGKTAVSIYRYLREENEGDYE
ncbi:16S rRNA (guanine(966)-N(2))-methyltransferase RsmD [Scopulibacillus darangshiensis]|uniref:16S rRNA (Guanine(966)-N(2))-methyltransferase RsmD n=1 Tax=Scopulibacillus darangshiensis TaxID=442528 RepID=A0A4V2SNA6_9BACL|nr:16S rRNA (guanine(966)-N(2))-methyltransferase RsmD [Scopulibacillus darangshiensis]TCP30486.1 16S rRNA (guanine(966)-N(2))-methyltransferase RsmD [Scopulibacillus darangshiensis]